MQHKPVCPIVSGNPKYLGLTQIEWALALFIFLFISFVPPPYSYFGYGVWVIGIIVYPKIAQRYEENFIMVLVESFKIPSTLIGQFKRAIPPYKIQSGSLIDKK
jgi:hypothetical protein